MAREWAPLTASERNWLIVIVSIATLLRLFVNDLSQFSPADESIYTDFTARLVKGGFFNGYADLARMWVADSRWWIYPSPLRFGHLALTTIAAHLYGSSGPRALASLSTTAGILVIPLLFSAARRIASARTALLATAFAAVSPLQLALGRRALQDEVFCAAVVLAFVAVLQLLDTEGKRAWRAAGAVGALTAALAVKESFLLLYPAFVLFVIAWRWPRRPALHHAAALVFPPLLWWAAMTALTQDATMLFRMARLAFSASSAPYVVEYQAGPPHRLLFDFFIVSPFTTVLACAAVIVILAGGRGTRPIRALTLFVITGWIAFSLLGSKNLRFVVMLDPFLRILAAWMAVSAFDPATRAPTVVAVGAANAAIDLEMFRSIFLAGQVYDPVTHTLLAALGAVPREAAKPPPPMFWPWWCGAVIVAAWLWRSAFSARREARQRPVRPATGVAAGAPR